MHDITLTIEPSEKYREVIDGEPPETDETPPTETAYQAAANHAEATNAYLETRAQAPSPEDMGVSPDEVEPLSWADFNVASDPDLVSRMATYFDGVDASEPVDLIRAKLRLLPCEIYANVQMAATAELNT